MDFVIMDEAHIAAGWNRSYADTIAKLAPIKGDGWTKKSKGNAKVYTHPGVPDGRAIVENHWGVTFNGVKYPSVDLAKIAALGGAS